MRGLVWVAEQGGLSVDQVGCLHRDWCGAAEVSLREPSSSSSTCAFVAWALDPVARMLRLAGLLYFVWSVWAREVSELTSGDWMKSLMPSRNGPVSRDFPCGQKDIIILNAAL